MGSQYFLLHGVGCDTESTCYCVPTSLSEAAACSEPLRACQGSRAQRGLNGECPLWSQCCHDIICRPVQSWRIPDRAFILHSPLRLVPSTGKDCVVTVTSSVPWEHWGRVVASREQRISLFLLILFVLGVVSVQALHVWMNSWVCMQRSEKKASHSIALYFAYFFTDSFCVGCEGCICVCESVVLSNMGAENSTWASYRSSTDSRLGHLSDPSTIYL